MSETIFPKETNDLEKTGRGGMALLHYSLNYNHWEYRQETGADKGRDCSLEYIEGAEWHNSCLRGQVKGTRTPNSYLLKSGTHFSYQLEKKTINYALRSKDAFILFLCDLTNEKVYYLPIQDYFINNPENYEKLEKDTEKMNIRIPVANVLLRDDDEELVKLSYASYNYNNNKVYKTMSDS